MCAAKGSRIHGHLKALAIDNLYFRKALKAKKLYGSLSLWLRCRYKNERLSGKD